MKKLLLFISHFILFVGLTLYAPQNIEIGHAKSPEHYGNHKSLERRGVNESSIAKPLSVKIEECNVRIQKEIQRYKVAKKRKKVWFKVARYATLTALILLPLVMISLFYAVLTIAVSFFLLPIALILKGGIPPDLQADTPILTTTMGVLLLTFTAVILVVSLVCCGIYAIHERRRRGRLKKLGIAIS